MARHPSVATRIVSSGRTYRHESRNHMAQTTRSAVLCNSLPRFTCAIHHRRMTPNVRDERAPTSRARREPNSPAVERSARLRWASAAPLLNSVPLDVSSENRSG
jgi:hypothetical protein